MAANSGARGFIMSCAAGETGRLSPPIEKGWLCFAKRVPVAAQNQNHSYLYIYKIHSLFVLTLTTNIILVLV